MHEGSTSSSRNKRRPDRAVVLAVVGSAALVGACGSSGKPSGGGPTGGPLLKLAHCMRANGVTDFPDPRPTGGLVIPNNINPESPAFLSAQHACARFGGTPPQGGKFSESEKLELLDAGRCMRKHGLPRFPDPTTAPPLPPAPGTHTGNVIGGGGLYLVLPPQSPAFKQAAAACRFRFP
jgi:hypothetical protein